MEEVFPNLYVGNQISYETGSFNQDEWSFCLAAKEPWHRRELGYTGRAAPKNHPEYLFARRGNRLILNLVDAPSAEFFDKRIIDVALDFIEEQLKIGRKVLIACNQGESRSPSIALLYTVSRGLKLKNVTLEQYEVEFAKKYPAYNPGTGIRGFLQKYWSEYVSVS